jgi:dihydropteroate synthase
MKYSLSDLLIQKPVLVMGILNVTPDSFSDGGDFLDQQAAVDHAISMINEGAEIIDVGGESTRPKGKTYGEGAQEVTIEEELRRVIGVIKGIRQINAEVLISIDTTKAEVARAAIEAGADIINDVSAGTSDPKMFVTARDLNVPLILMHGHGPFFKRENIEEYEYENVTRTVLNYLRMRIIEARNFGVREVLADVGIGFAKVYNENVKLMREHEQFKSLGVPLVIGVSRKATIGKMLGENIPPKDRASGSLAAALYCVQKGARIIRTHDVKLTADAVKVWAELAKQ